MANRISITNDPRYCLNTDIELKIVEGVVYRDDENGDTVFSIKSPASLHDRRILHDHSENPLLTLRKVKPSLHGRYEVFRGDRTDSARKLFSVRRPTVRKGEDINLNVYLATNTGESVPDFTVKAPSSKNIFHVRDGDKILATAKMEKNDTFNVSVCANVDHAFIVALLVIAVGKKHESMNLRKIAKVARTGIAVGASVATGCGLLGGDDDE